MPAIDKLIDLLEQIKETDPSFSDRAGKALDALIGEGEEEEVLEVQDEDIEESEPEPEPEPEPPEPEPEPEPVVEEKPIFPSSVELKKHHLKEIVTEQGIINQKITELGLLVQNYEADKERLLEIVEQKHTLLTKYIAGLGAKYNLDPNCRYSIEFPTSPEERARFVKRD